MGFFIGCGAILKQGDGYVLVQEVRAAKKHLYNLPAGTLEPHEDLQECLLREIYEETGVSAQLEHFVGMYQTVLADGNNILFFVFAGSAPEDVQLASSEHKNIATYSFEQIQALDAAGKLRAPSVLKSISDYRAGQAYSLAAIQAVRYDKLASITVV